MRPSPIIRRLALSTLVCALAANARPAPAAGAPEGSAVSPRARLAARGVSFEGSLSADGLRVARGGLERRSVALAVLDAAVTFDLGTLAGWTGTSAHVRLVGHHGASPSEAAGDLQALDNLDLPDVLRPAEVWIEASGEGGSVRAGLYDLNTEFDTGEVSALFLNSSHGLGADLAQCGDHGPSVYPCTALGARGAWTPARGLAARVALTDGAPGDPDRPSHVDLDWRPADGTTVIGELEHVPAAGRADARVVLGAWHTSGRFHDVRDLDATGLFPLRDGDLGLYGRVEGTLARERGEGQGLAGWVRAGWTRPTVNAFDRYTGGGLVYTGALPGRDADALGVAMAIAHAGGAYFDQRVAAGLPSDRLERAYEVTYRAELGAGLAIQPDVQYIQHPGLDPAVADAVVIGARLQLSF